ncbi:MAG: four helix bundle suffix domain-containing protein [Candidatus Binatia bacterium]|nr:four helix bundle suffix domain-containing protein [Candidatus Binatia bacterium]
MSTPEENFIPPHGNYQELLSYQKAEVVYDLTFRFCERFLKKGDRTIDQMVQAARSGKQNIVEGSKASGTSKEMEIKLTNVARASLEELLVDYQDYLRFRDLKLWPKDSMEAQYVRKLGNKSHVTYETYREFCESRPAEVVANIAICLIHHTNYLLDQQIRRLEKDFVQHGGLRERMTRVRLAWRNRNQGTKGNDEPPQIPRKTEPPGSHPSPDSHKPSPKKPGGRR